VVETLLLKAAPDICTWYGLYLIVIIILPLMRTDERLDTTDLGEFLVPLKRNLSHAPVQWTIIYWLFMWQIVPYDTEETMRPSYINFPSKQQQVHTINDWMNDGASIMQTLKKIVQSNHVDQILKLWFLVVML